MKKETKKVVLASFLTVAAFVYGLFSTNVKLLNAQTASEVTICHATGSAENPYNTLHVSSNAIGGHFQNNGTPKNGHEDDLLLQGTVECPGGSTPTPTATPVRTPVPTPTPTVVPTVSPTPTVVPTMTPTPTATPTASPTPEASATATPNGDICANLDGIQLTMPDEYHQAGVNCLKYELGGPPPPPAVSTSQVLGASTSRVLGASTMAGTGAVEDAIFNSMFTLGSLLTSFGIMKNGKKKS